MRMLYLFVLLTTQTLLFAAGADRLKPKQPASVSSNKREWEIVSDGLKDLKIGDSPKKIYKVFAGLTIKYYKDDDTYVIYDKTEILCGIECDETGLVYSIYSESKRFFHSGGMRVGLRVDEVIRKRPGIIMTYNGMDDEESLLLYDHRKKNKIEVELLTQSDNGEKLGVCENEY